MAQAISRVRAEQSGLWHRHADGSERERSGPAVGPVYDAKAISAAIDETIEHERSWDAWAAGQGFVQLDVSYEQLSADPRATLGAVLAALGRDPAIAARAEVQTARLADTTSRQWADRYARDQAV